MNSALASAKVQRRFYCLARPPTIRSWYSRNSPPVFLVHTPTLAVQQTHSQRRRWWFGSVGWLVGVEQSQEIRGPDGRRIYGSAFAHELATAAWLHLYSRLLPTFAREV